MRRVLHFVFAPAELPGGLRWPLRGRSQASMSRWAPQARIEAYLGEVGRSLEWPSEVVAGGCFELYSNYPLQIQAVAASIATTGPLYFIAANDRN